MEPPVQISEELSGLLRKVQVLERLQHFLQTNPESTKRGLSVGSIKATTK